MDNCSSSTVLTDKDFSIDGTNYVVVGLYWASLSRQLAWSFSGIQGSAAKTALNGLTLNIGGTKLAISAAQAGSVLVWSGFNPGWMDDDTVSLSLTSTASAASTAPPVSRTVVDPTQRSWPLTAIADEGPTEFWFPIGRGRCDMKDWDRPWTWKRWTPPTADKCGWISIPDVRADLEEPVDELAFKVWTALLPSPEIGGRAAFGRPSGRSIKLAVWALYPHPERDSNSVRRLTGPYEQPITVCVPGSDAQAIYGYDKQEWKWVALESVEAEHEGHICGLHGHDLGLLVVGRKPSP